MKFFLLMVAQLFLTSVDADPYGEVMAVVGLKSHRNGKYITVGYEGGSRNVTAGAPHIAGEGAWERFDLIVVQEGALMQRLNSQIAELKEINDQNLMLCREHCLDVRLQGVVQSQARRIGRQAIQMREFEARLEAIEEQIDRLSYYFPELNWD